MPQQHVQQSAETAAPTRADLQATVTRGDRFRELKDKTEYERLVVSKMLKFWSSTIGPLTLHITSGQTSQH
jgi:hypothetical protein